MTDEQRAVRVTELQQLRRDDPAALIELYRRLVGLGPLAILPPDLTLPGMIQAIVDIERSGAKPKRSYPRVTKERKISAASLGQFSRLARRLQAFSIHEAESFRFGPVNESRKRGE
jgi:hypothetical protein